MTIEIIQEAHDVEHEEWVLSYSWHDDPGAGFSFSSDEDGNMTNENEAAIANYEYARAHPELLKFNGHMRRTWTTREPNIGRCYCGEEVVLDGFTNTCDECGRDYNWNGTLLADRSQWGEETGEHPADIARIP